MPRRFQHLEDWFPASSLIRTGIAEQELAQRNSRSVEEAPDHGRTCANPYVFISYASVDRERVREVAADLDAIGVKYWLDQADIPGGTSYGPEIVDGIKKRVRADPDVFRGLARFPQCEAGNPARLETRPTNSSSDARADVFPG